MPPVYGRVCEGVKNVAGWGRTCGEARCFDKLCAGIAVRKARRRSNGSDWIREARRARRHRVGGAARQRCGREAGGSGRRHRRRTAGPRRGRDRLELVDAAPGSGPSRHHPDQASLGEAAADSGIRNSDTIIFYGDNNNWFAACAYWRLKMYGHKNVRLMNGGRKKWLARGATSSPTSRSLKPASYKAREDPTLRARLQAEVLAAHRRARATHSWMCARPHEFTGEILAPPGLQETAQRGGPHPRRHQHPLAAGRERGTAPSSPPTS